MTYKPASEKFHDLQTWPWKFSWPTNMPLKNFMTYKHGPEKFHYLHAFSYVVFFERNIDFQRKFWIETHIRSHILVIMDQKSRLHDKPFLSNEDPLKKGDSFFQLFLVFDQFIVNITKKRQEIPPKPTSLHENWVQNDFSTISSYWDMATWVLADHVTFLNHP